MIYLAAGLFTLAVCLCAQPLGRFLGVIDMPDGRRKLHRAPTPLIGGIAIALPAIAVAVFEAVTSEFAPLYGALAAAAAVLTLIGFLDDRRHIRAALRLFLSAVVFGIVLWLVPGLSLRFIAFSFVEAVPPVFLGPLVGAAFSIVCLVGLQNAVNMADGKNGLVIGISLIWTLVLLAIAPAHLETLLVVLAIGLSITLVFNITGRVFLGDAGTYGLSVFVGLLTLYLYNTTFVAFPADAAVLLFLIPILDTVRLMVSRALKGRSPFSSDRDHLHHVLLALMPWHWALTVYLLLVASPILLARFFVDWTGILVVATVVVYALLIAQKYRPTAAATSGAGST